MSQLTLCRVIGSIAFVLTFICLLASLLSNDFRLPALITMGLWVVFGFLSRRLARPRRQRCNVQPIFRR